MKRFHCAFIPGFANSSCIYNQLIEVMDLDTNSYTLIDLPNKSGQIKNTAAARRNYLKSFVSSIEEKLQNRPTVVVASSLGGMFALEMANQLKNLKGLILIGVNLKFIQTEDWLCAMDATTFGSFKHGFHHNPTKALERFFTLELLGDSFDEQVTKKESIRSLRGMEALDIPTSRFFLDCLELMDLRTEISKINIPIHFIFGEKDALVPSQVADQLKVKIDNTQTQIKMSYSLVKSAGHLPMLTHPMQMKKNIEQFINSIANE